MVSPTIRRRVKTFLLWVEILIILVLGAGMGVVLGAFYQMHKLLPPDAALDHYRPPVGSRIYSSDGVLLAKLAAEDRDPVPLSRVPQHMRDAMVAIEDSRFYQHSGLDFRGLARALWANVRGQELAQGGSTITQQLARNMFLNSRKKLSRKIKEILLAVQIERNWTKSKILEAYLNQVYFGAGAYGVSSAAKTYFGKKVEDLSLDEAAMLAGLPQRPSELSPYAAYREDGNHDRTRVRRDMVLGRMEILGFVSAEEAAAARKKPISVGKVRPRTSGFLRAKYFVQHVVDQLREQGYDQEILEKAGLSIETTLNWKMQAAAEEAAREELAKIRKSRRVTDTALVALDPHTGYIRAMVGGVNEPWEKYQFNCATQAMRQPGSSFKLFVYATAMERGDTPRTGVAGSAIPVRMPDGKYYAPKNHGRAGGYMDYRSAFASSVNGAAVNVCVKVGPRKVVDLARRLGLKGNLRAYPSLALGSSEATVLEMASAYGVFPARGKRAEPLAILRIRGQDRVVIEDFQPRITATGLKPSTIEGIDTLTRAVVTSGTGRVASTVPDAHGKTGTSENYTDAWFVGYTPELVTAVWCGNRDNSQMARVYGGTISAPIWARFMRQAVELNPAAGSRPRVAKEPARRRPERRRTPVAAPVGADSSDRNRVRAVVCPESGFLAGENCPSRESLEFLLGDQPLRRCPTHTAGRPAPEKPSETAEPQPTPAPAGA